MAAYNQTSQKDNVAVGYKTLYNNGFGGTFNGQGDRNVAIGYETMTTNINGSSNTAIGAYSLRDNNGWGNVAIGTNAMQTSTTAEYNTAVGIDALLRNNSANNIAVGPQALRNNQTGNSNVGIGRDVGFLNNGSGNVFLGFQAGYNERGNNLLYIENSSSSVPLIGGDFSNRKVGINRSISALTNAFEVEGEASKANPGSWVGNSDRRLKKNVVYLDSEEILQKILQMKGVSYEWNDTQTGMKRPNGIQFGFIAQDLKEIFPNKVNADNLGFLQTAYGDYDPMLVEAIKGLYNKIERLQNDNLQLKSSTEEMKSELNLLKASVDALLKERVK